MNVCVGIFYTMTHLLQIKYLSLNWHLIVLVVLIELYCCWMGVIMMMNEPTPRNIPCTCNSFMSYKCLPVEQWLNESKSMVKSVKKHTIKIPLSLAYTYVCMCACTHACACACVRAHTHVHECVGVCACMCERQADQQTWKTTWIKKQLCFVIFSDHHSHHIHLVHWVVAIGKSSWNKPTQSINHPPSFMDKQWLLVLKQADTVNKSSTIIHG